MIINDRIIRFINNIGASEFDPFYIYDSELIKKHCKCFLNLSYPYKSIHFASMANVNVDFLNIVRTQGIHIFVNSLPHLEIALKQGFKNEEIIFTSSALTTKAMHFISKLNIQVNLDSPLQLENWQKQFPGKPTGIRCNIGDNVLPYGSHAGYFIGKESRLGFTYDELIQIVDKSIINGLHLYVGTDLFDIDYFIRCYESLMKMAALFPALGYLNFGGGFGVSENGEDKFDFDTYNTKLSAILAEFNKGREKDIHIILEPGRIIGGNAGYFVCAVTDIKYRGDKQLIGVNASSVQFSRPLLYPDIARHPVCLLRNGKVLSGSLISSAIYGCSTYSRDYLSRKAELPLAQAGDIVVLGNAGSYSASSHSTFLGFEKAAEYYI